MQKGKAIGIDRLQGQFPVSYHSVPKGELNIVGTQANFREISRSAASVDELDSEKQIELNSVIKGLKHKNVAASLKRKRSIDSRKLGMHIGSLNMVHAQFRSNNDKTKHKFVAKNKVSVRSQLMDNKLLRVFFRNQTVSLLSLLNRRDDYFSCLRGKRL